jgi:HemY protein
MLRLVFLLIILAALAFGFSQLADQPGDISVNWGNLHIEVSLLVGTIGLLLAVVVLSILWGLIRFILRIPSLVSLANSARRRAKGFSAISRGMVALGAGDQKVAHLAAREAEKHLKDEPLALLLKAQTAQMAGDRQTAEATFAQMTQHPEMRVLGLRGLHVEARRRGDTSSAHLHAREAAKHAAVPWASEALLEHATAHADWTAALAHIDRAVAARLIEKTTANRQRAVLKTALALEKQADEPVEALKLGKEAMALAPDLIPAMALVARLYVGAGDHRKARKLIESVWPKLQHPDFVRIYLDLPGGDKAAERLKRAETLLKMAPDAPDSMLAVAKAAIATRDFNRAETVLAPLVQLDGPERPTNRACIAMAELEEARGTEGRAREWLARAARAPRDATWVADGVASDLWAPVSPVTGKIDAFRWERPREHLAAFDYEAPAFAESASFNLAAEPPSLEAQLEKLSEQPLPPPKPAPLRSQPVIFPLSKAPDDPGYNEFSEASKPYTGMLD